MDVRSLSEANDLHPNGFDSCWELVVEDGNWKRASEYESCLKPVLVVVVVVKKVSYLYFSVHCSVDVFSWRDEHRSLKIFLVKRIHIAYHRRTLPFRCLITMNSIMHLELGAVRSIQEESTQTLKTLRETMHFGAYFRLCCERKCFWQWSPKNSKFMQQPSWSYLKQFNYLRMLNLGS